SPVSTGIYGRFLMQTLVSHSTPFIGCVPKPALDRTVSRKNLTEPAVRDLVPQARAYYVWDAWVPPLCVRILPSDTKSFFTCIGFAVRRGSTGSGGRPNPSMIFAGEPSCWSARWRTAATLTRKRWRSDADTFEQVHGRYLSEHAKKQNKSWEQA